MKERPKFKIRGDLGSL